MNFPTLDKSNGVTCGSNGEVQIAVAVAAVFGEFTSASSTLLVNAMLAGMQRNAVGHVSSGDYFVEHFSVMLFTVPRSSNALALAAIRGVLADLKLSEAATIATYTDEQIWVTIEGFAKGSDAFQEMFLRPQDFANARAKIEAMKKTHKQRVAALMLEIMDRLAASQSRSK